MRIGGDPSLAFGALNRGPVAPYPSPGASEGVIALQLHSGGEGRMRFKDIHIRDFTER